MSPSLVDLFCCEGGAGRGYADAGFRVLTETIRLLRTRDVPWVVENVESRINKQDMEPRPGEHLFRLCGSSFGLGARDSRGRWRILTRHRLFLTNFPVTAPLCRHQRGDLVGGVYGHGEQGVNGGRGYGFAADAAREALRMPWVTREGAKEAIPPAYTEYIGRHLIEQL